MAVGSEAVVNSMVATILATTPNAYPGVPYALANGEGDLGEQLMQGDDAQRVFRVHARPDVTPAWWSGELAEVRQTYVVQVLYRVPPDLGGARLAQAMAGADAARLTWALTMRFDVDAAPELTSIEGLSSRDLQDLGSDIYLMELELTATYFLGAELTPPEISP